MGFSEERNFRFGVLVLFAVMLGGWWLRVPPGAYVLIVGAWVLLLAVELVNAAFERFADAIHPKYSQIIGTAKDMLAGAVLLLAAGAAGATLLLVVATIRG